MIIRLLAVALLAMSCAACFEKEVRLKADTIENFETSYAAATENMSLEKRVAFDRALKDIVLVESGLYGPAASALLAEKTDQPAFVQALTKNLGQGLLVMASQALDQTWETKKATIVVKNAKLLVDGRTPDEIIRLAADERKKALESALQVYQTQLKEAEKALETEQVLANEADAKSAEQAQVLAKIIITKPKFSYDGDSYMERPVVSFDIKNGSGIPIKRIFINGKVQTPGRAVPWVEDSFNFVFRGGLEPNERQHLDLNPNMFSDWGKVPKEAVKSALTTLELTAIEDATDKRIGVSTNDDHKERIESLQRGIEDIKKKIEEVSSELAKSQG